MNMRMIESSVLKTVDKIKQSNNGDFLYLISKAEGGYKILDKEGL